MFVASWNGEEIARSEGCILVENSLYFPPDSIRAGALVPGNGNSQCYWKGGKASYFDVHAAGKVNLGACARARCRAGIPPSGATPCLRALREGRAVLDLRDEPEIVDI